MEMLYLKFERDGKIQLSQEEKDALHAFSNFEKEIEKMKNDGVRVVVIAEKIGVHRATIYNELKRGGTPYRAEVAQKTI